MSDDTSRAIAKSDLSDGNASPVGEATKGEVGGNYGQKAKQGIKLMLGRQIVIQVLTFGGGIVLARTLSPEIFGVFGISMFLVNTLALLGDFGLGPSLVQRKEEFNEHDLQVAFTLQQGLLTFVSVAIWISAPYFLLLYSDLGGPEYIWLIRTMAVMLFLQSWRSMSVLRMERHLNFKWIARIEIVESLSFQAFAVGLALAGFGVWSLAWATLLRALLGTSVAFLISPWKARLAWDREKSIAIARYGIPFQLGTILNSLSDWVTPLAVGSLVGPAGVGLLTWASSNGRKPQALLAVVNRVSFPHFSRMQGNEAGTLSTFSRYLEPIMLVCGLWFFLMFAIADIAVPFIYTEKWYAATPSLILFSFVLVVSTVAQLISTVMKANGMVNANTVLTAINTVLCIAISVPLISILGILSIPIAALVGTLAVSIAKAFWLPFNIGGRLAKAILKLAVWLAPACILMGLLKWQIHASATAVLATTSTIVSLIALVALKPLLTELLVARSGNASSPMPAEA